MKPERLEAKGVIPSGRNATHCRTRGWTARPVWRIGKRHAIMGAR